MKIYLVRHGESESNVMNIFSGFSDVDLTERGLEQAQCVANHLSTIEFDLVVSSPLMRAKKTADIIVQQNIHHLIIETNARFKEMNFGVWEGNSFERIIADYPDEAAQWMQDYVHFICPGGESLKLFYERIRIAYKTSLEQWRADGKKQVLLVAHAGVMQSILASELQDHIDGYWRYKFENCGLAVLEYDNEFAMLSQLDNTASRGV